MRVPGKVFGIMAKSRPNRELSITCSGNLAAIHYQPSAAKTHSSIEPIFIDFKRIRIMV
jgi:hypothetical protein